MDETYGEIAGAVEAIGRIEAVPTLLDVLCETTGMRFAAVARVTETTWTACAVRDGMHLGLGAGTQFPSAETLCCATRTSRAPIVIEHAAQDPHYAGHEALKRYGIESYVSVPILMANGGYFGTLCAFDSEPRPNGAGKIVSMFTRFAALIAAQLDQQLHQDLEHSALLDERAAGELREQFIAILGHDLRNPLQAVYAAGDTLERKLLDPALLEIASRIKTNVRRMSLLIDDVLDFARGRLGGGIGVELTEVKDINTGLMTVIQELKDVQPERDIDAKIGVSRPVRCDLGRLQQVASNLLANAITHGAPATAVKISATDDDQDLVLTVWNAGEPISPESIGKIFEPFWRHSASASRNGLGLGLHICSQIVRAHGGSISVTSTREEGTRFIARFPLGVLPRGGAARLGPMRDLDGRPRSAAFESSIGALPASRGGSTGESCVRPR